MLVSTYTLDGSTQYAYFFKSGLCTPDDIAWIRDEYPSLDNFLDWACSARHTCDGEPPVRYFSVWFWTNAYGEIKPDDDGDNWECYSLYSLVNACRELGVELTKHVTEHAVGEWIEPYQKQISDYRDTILGEDLSEFGIIKSHFDNYLKAMTPLDIAVEEMSDIAGKPIRDKIDLHARSCASVIVAALTQFTNPRAA